MKRVLATLVGILLAGPVVAQDELPQPDEIIQSVQQWVDENLDRKALDELGLDQDRVERFLAELRRRFRGNHVYELGALHETATNVLVVLQQFEETRPYAAWLKARIDYFEVAEELLRRANSSSDILRPPFLPNPPQKIERSVWVRELTSRSLPPLAQNYVPRLKEIFSEERLPPELVWVAEVESSFNPEARSPAGAVGLFQLMPQTARSLNLATFLPDERLQPEKNARAAARYLRRLYDRFGDWRLALAAYNAGETRVDELLKKSQTRTFDNISDHLPAEAQMYVPRIEATISKREGVSLAELKRPKS